MENVLLRTRDVSQVPSAAQAVTTLPPGWRISPSADEIPRRLETGFFGELALGGGEGILVLTVLALGDGPGSVVFVLPEGPSRMAQQDFVRLDVGSFPPEQENASAALGHMLHAPPTYLAHSRQYAGRPGLVSRRISRMARRSSAERRANLGLVFLPERTS